MPPTALNHYVSLGRSGLRVSPLCLGTMTFGLEWGWGSTPEDSAQILDAYIAAGGNFIDTANIYTRGHSEKIVGDHVGRTPSKRDRLVIATKFFGNLHTGDPNAGGGGRKNMMSACEESLRRLQTDYIDLYWMHAWDRFTPMEESIRGLDDLVGSGKVRYVGFSDTPAWKCAQAQTLAAQHGWSPVIALQIEYSLLERTVEGELMPMALEMGMGVTPWSPLAGGALSGKYTRENAGKANIGRGEWVANRLTEKGYSIVDRLVAIGKETGATPAQVALAWLQEKPGVVSSIIGARTMEQLKDNLGALGVPLTAAHMASLDEVSKPQLNFPHEFLERTLSVMQGGTTINGRASEPWPLAPKNDAERY
jgi:aryl-alcohol dehydrogenase-like predicted oxidoreductase